MKSSLMFDFIVNKQDKSICITREFDAHVSLVWQAWTTPALLDQWWGPVPWRAETKSMEFREGGHWLYAMVSPEGERHWSKVSYISIHKEKSFVAKDGFSDENGNLNLDFPQNIWENQFSARHELTLVKSILTFNTLGDLERIIEMGFQEGFAMGLSQLEKLLHILNSRLHET